MLTACLAESRNACRLLAPRDAIRWHLGALAHLRAVASGATLAPADRYLGDRFSLRLGGRRFLLLGTDFGVCRELLGHDCYRLLPASAGARHIMDLGANAGVFSLFAAIVAPDCRVTAVEANPGLVEVARLNLEAAGVLPRVMLLNEVVGRPAVKDVEIVAATGGIRRFSPDDAIARWGRCDFLKCDVEGSEHSLFDGDPEWLDAVDAMAIEYHWTPSDGARLAAALRDRGFRVEIEPRRRLGYLHCRRSAASR